MDVFGTNRFGRRERHDLLKCLEAPAEESRACAMCSVVDPYGNT